MNLSSITSLFKKKEQSLKLPESLLIKKLKEVAEKNSLSIYENITIYHHTQSYFIPLLLLDPNRGIYLFEYKEWSYDDLKNATVSKATNEKSTNKNLRFERTHEFIKQKFNELTHNDGVSIYNYLLMPNLNNDEYIHLNESFKELLPEQKIFFNDSSDLEIVGKIKDTPKPKMSMPNEANIMGNLLVQYLILSQDQKIYLASKEQIDFIESNKKGLQILGGKSYAGKTSSIILKAILENLRHPKLKIIIIEPTVLACDILKKKLLEIVEYAIIEVDITQIEIITPIALVNKHLMKLKKQTLDVVLYIDVALMKKSFKVADLIICDDANLIDLEFIEYLEHIQDKASLIIVNEDIQDPTFMLERGFRKKEIEVIFKQANQYAKALQIIATLLKNNKVSDILVVGDGISKRNLIEDLEFFVDGDSISVDANNNLENQNLESLLLCSYAQISGMKTKYTILMDIEDASLNEVQYAINLASDSTYLLYENESQNINTLKEIYE